MGTDSVDQNVNRYHRQILLPQIGSDGQARLARSRVMLVGCGALGTVMAEHLVRGGVGFLRLVDRDLVELTNLQRQTLFDEADAAELTPKAIAAARRLSAINSDVRIEPIVANVDSGNIEKFAAVDLVLDGTDNVETRGLINDVAVKHGLPWVYAACVGMTGRVMPIRPGESGGPCLRCVFPELPTPAELPSCDTAGVFAPAAAIVASLAAAAAIKLLIGVEPANELTAVDVWTNRIRSIAVGDKPRPDCPVCGRREFAFLAGSAAQRTVSLCGQNAVQFRPGAGTAVDLEMLEAKLRHSGAIRRNAHLLRCELHAPAGVSLTVFPDGRAIVHGAAGETQARSIYARFVGT
ncbi:MAG TPA: ThiF family adenylyltransferase [Tepidisphaeraceae bacterium]|jgi:adenylyltransferase/sulfurtransferase|nr:ThiF family adenylyltransferase [Tepidisphaeraceae bacterium]